MCRLGIFIVASPQANRHNNLCTAFVCWPRRCKASEGASAIIRYDPRDMVETHIFHDHRFLCRTLYTALAG